MYIHVDTISPEIVHVKHFAIAPSVSISPDEKSAYHVLSLDAGLLSRLVHVLLNHGASLHAARINTLGNHTEDTLGIPGRNGKTLPQKTARLIEQELLGLL
jgi:UTP:GlnB (protein PII) uridylyltransferase